MEINESNWQDFIGEKVNVEIGCYEFGLMYPDDNYLKDFDGNTWTFESEEAEGGEWSFDVDDPDCSIGVFSINDEEE